MYEAWAFKVKHAILHVKMKTVKFVHRRMILEQLETFPVAASRTHVQPDQ